MQIDDTNTYEGNDDAADAELAALLADDADEDDSAEDDGEQAPAARKPQSDEDTSTDDGEAETDDDGEAETDDDGEPRVKFTEEQQRVFDKVIARKTAAHKAELRAYEARMAELSQGQQQADPNAPPEIPELPNIWDKDYDQKIAARDEAIAKRSEWEYNNRARQTQQQEQQQSELKRVVAGYSENAKKQGITPEALQKAGQQINAFGINNDVAAHILRMDVGPSITMYLAENPGELMKLDEMTPIQAAVYITESIKPQATKRKAPPPPARRQKTSTTAGGGKRRAKITLE